VIAQPDGVYAGWVSWLSRFGGGEVDSPEGLEAMDGNALGAPAAARLARHVEIAFQNRLQIWSGAFDRELKRVGTPDDVRRANIAARRRFEPITALASSPPLLPELVAQLKPTLDEVLAKAQAALDEQARRLGGDGAVLAAVRDTPLTAMRTEPVEFVGAPTETASAAVGRRVIIFPRKDGYA
jgi:hypothetical protein